VSSACPGCADGLDRREVGEDEGREVAVASVLAHDGDRVPELQVGLVRPRRGSPGRRERAPGIGRLDDAHPQGGRDGGQLGGGEAITQCVAEGGIERGGPGSLGRGQAGGER
jgi:hypothetical protein